MMDGTLETIDGRQALRFERRLAHPVARVWRAVTEPAELDRWFVATPQWTPVLHETFEAYGQRGEITALDPPRLIAWTWGGERYSFELTPADGGSMLVFLHFFDETRGPGAQHAAGWESYLDRLDGLLGGRELSEEEAHRIVPELSERYAVAMNADPGPARESYARYGPLQLSLEDGPALRFIRRYGYPIERVWRAISDPGERKSWFPSDAETDVVESHPPRLLVLSFWGDPLRFELEPDGDGCRLTFTHTFADREGAARTAAGWDRCITRMDAHLAGGSLGEAQALELWPTVHERYAEAFHVDPELGRKAFRLHPLTTDA
jgi:uncharacterized protein YndB with AHSA1/START domain